MISTSYQPITTSVNWARGTLLTSEDVLFGMSSQDDNTGVPLPVSVLLEQEHDEECIVYLSFDAFNSEDNYTNGRLVAVSELTSAEYTITTSFQIPCKNISELRPRTEMNETRILLNECSTKELATLFDMVSISYEIGTDTAEVDN